MSYFDKKDLERAYKKLKNKVYYENYDLFLKAMLANFENNQTIENVVHRICEQDLIRKLREALFEKDEILLNQIDYYVLPKKIIIGAENDVEKSSIGSSKANESNSNPSYVENATAGTDKKEDSGSSFITNDKTANLYNVEGINYIISCPIIIHVLDTLWTWKVGKILDSKFDKCSWGNRIADDVDENDFSLFKNYQWQYSQWKNQGLEVMNDILKRNDATLVMLDIKQCYYHASVDWKKIKKEIEDYCNNQDTPEEEKNKKNFYINLTEFIKAVHDKYWEKLKGDLENNFEGFIEKKDHVGIPIGLASSCVLNNYCLNEIDTDIIRNARPSSYGRYVDDMILVFNTPDKLVANTERNADSFISKLFGTTNIFGKCYEENIPNDKPKDKPDSELEKNSDDGLGVDRIDVLYFKKNNNLQIQKDKLKVIYLKKNQSKAILNNFLSELRLTVSEFRYLPEEPLLKDLDAYSIEIDDSMHKLRSILNAKENITVLKSVLHKLMIQYSLSKISKNDEDKIVGLLVDFFQGQNLLLYYNLWELVFTLLVMMRRDEELNRFNDDIEVVLAKVKKAVKKDKVSLVSKTISCDSTIKKIITDLLEFRDICYSLALALCGGDMRKNNERANNIRASYLFRAQHVCFPLIEYCDDSIELFDLKVLDYLEPLKAMDVKQFQKKIAKKPRYVHIDEKQLFGILYQVANNESDLSLCDVEFLFNTSAEPNKGEKHSFSFQYLSFENGSPEIKSVNDNLNNGVRIVHHWVDNENGDDQEHDMSIKIGLANMNMKDGNASRSYRPDRSPNIDHKRKVELYALLNTAIREKCNLVIFPEFAIPHAWLPLMAVWARKHQIGAVFGLEHWIVGNKAHNFIATLLPFHDAKHRTGSYVTLRNKNFYAPAEIKKLEKYSYDVRVRDVPRYDIFKWRGIQFTSYICYELTNLRHRGLFFNEIDMLIACVHNKDINYFSNILESSCRDLHCYAVQANNSRWGDSRVIMPTKHELKNITRVTGGENNVLLTATLDIGLLREHQLKNPVYYDDEDGRFKPVPADYDNKLVLNRSKSLIEILHMLKKKIVTRILFKHDLSGGRF